MVISLDYDYLAIFDENELLLNNWSVAKPLIKTRSNVFLRTLATTARLRGSLWLPSCQILPA